MCIYERDEDQRILDDFRLRENIPLKKGPSMWEQLDPKYIIPYTPADFSDILDKEFPEQPTEDINFLGY